MSNKRFEDLLNRAKQSGRGVPEQIAHETKQRRIAAQLAKFNAMTMSELVDYLEIVPTKNTWIYVNDDGFLCSTEKSRDQVEPVGILSYGYAKS